jgi:hypothetical protein
MLDMFRIFDAKAIKRNSHPTNKIMRQTNFAKIKVEMAKL